MVNLKKLDKRSRRIIARHLCERWNNAVQLYRDAGIPITHEFDLAKWERDKAIHKAQAVALMDEIMGIGQELYHKNFLVDRYCLKYNK